ncbi:MAG: KH domain-containing protein [Erysipelotrichaceae bacterium]|nr:KH domain-containing protein [Erysipelotrichaceae bacterium]
MVELDKVLYNLVKPMVDDINSLEVRQMPSLNDNEIILYVYAANDDVARLVGRQGNMAVSLRQMMSVASHVQNKKITIRFESI